MKPYLPIAIAAGLVVVGLAAALFLTPALAPPQARVQREIDGKIAQAQAMLAAYSPTDAALLRRFDAAVTSQPSTPEQPATQLDHELKQALEARKNLISQALPYAQEAVQFRVDDASGDSSPAATRLETILLIEQAQIHRREAGLQWRLAAQARGKARDHLAHWTDVDAQVRSLEATLSGQGVLKDHPASAATEPGADAPEAPTEHSRLGSLLGQLLRSKKPPATAPVPAAPVMTAPADVAVKTPAPVVTQPRPPAQPACTLSSSIEELLARQTQSPQQRIEDLRLCRTQVQERIAQARQQVDSLTPQVQAVRQQIDAAKAQADTAQKQMLALERAGVDATDPDSLSRFTREYTDASTTYRRALRTISTLTAGSSDTPQLRPEEREMLTQPPIEIDSALPQDFRGVTSLESDLEMARTLLDTQQKLLVQIDESIERLTQSQQQLTEYLNGRKTSRDRIAQDLAAAARAAVSHAVQAYQAESEALNILNNQAIPAAQRATSAASTGDGSVRGGAQALDGDINAAQAMVFAQRAAGLDKHAEMLGQMEPAAIPSVDLLAESSGEQAPGDWATKTGVATTEAGTSRDNAVKAATEAVGAYQQAASSARQLWTLHTEVAAMYYLLANVSTGEQTEDYIAKARKEFELATRDRRDRPEVQPLQAVYGKLTQAK